MRPDGSRPRGQVVDPALLKFCQKHWQSLDEKPVTAREVPKFSKKGNLNLCNDTFIAALHYEHGQKFLFPDGEEKCITTHDEWISTLILYVHPGKYFDQPTVFYPVLLNPNGK